MVCHSIAQKYHSESDINNQVVENDEQEQQQQKVQWRQKG